MKIMTSIRYAAIAAVLAGSAGMASAQQIEVSNGNRTISVMASDKASVDADLAVVHIGFQTYGPDEQTTYANGSKTSNAIIDALKKAGVPEKSIESENQGLQPNNYHDPKESDAERASKQFQLNQSWTVKTKPEDAAKTLHIAVEAGANQSGSIDWQYQDMNGLQAKAAANALVKAQAVAQQMADGLHVKLGNLLYASNQMQESPIRPVMMRAMAAAPMDAKVAPLAINARQIEESATVNAVFAIVQ